MWFQNYFRKIEEFHKALYIRYNTAADIDTSIFSILVPSVDVFNVPVLKQLTLCHSSQRYEI